MGPENSGGPFVGYIDGEGVVIGHPVPEITPDHSAGGVSATEAAQSLAAMTADMAGVSMTMEITAEGIKEFFDAIELANAIRLARSFEPGMVHLYVHTKKKRTRKKYEKRILAWFREVFR